VFVCLVFFCAPVFVFFIFLMVGICGGFTTFSAFSLQTLELIQTGAVVSAALYIAESVVLCLLAVWLGWALGRP